MSAKLVCNCGKDLPLNCFKLKYFQLQTGAEAPSVNIKKEKAFAKSSERGLLKRELNWGGIGDGQCKNDTFAIEGLCSLIFKAVWNKQYVQGFPYCCVWLGVFVVRISSGNSEFLLLIQIFVDFYWLWEMMLMKFRSYNTRYVPLCIEIWGLLPPCLHPQVHSYECSHFLSWHLFKGFLQAVIYLTYFGIGSVIILPYSI